jgi:transcriptional regulator with XRE-family HTH domain
MTNPATPTPHPLKLELEQRGFSIAKLAARAGLSYPWLMNRLSGKVPMTPEDEARIRAAMEPDATDGEASAEAQNTHPAAPAA